MRNIWPTLAEKFGMEVGNDKPMSLAEQMPKWQDSWEEAVQRFDLRAPVSLEEFVGQSFIYADFILGVGFEGPMPPMLVSTTKACKAVFQACMDIEDMFRKWIACFQQEHLLPPVARQALARATATWSSASSYREDLQNDFFETLSWTPTMAHSSFTIAASRRRYPVGSFVHKFPSMDWSRPPLARLPDVVAGDHREVTSKGAPTSVERDGLRLV